QGLQFNLLDLGAQLASDFVRDDSPQRSSADKIRPNRLSLAHLSDVVRRHVFDAGMRRVFAIQTSRLQSIERLVGTEMSRQIVILEHISADCVNAKEWQARDGGL